MFRHRLSSYLQFQLKFKSYSQMAQKLDFVTSIQNSSFHLRVQEVLAKVLIKSWKYQFISIKEYNSKVLGLVNQGKHSSYLFVNSWTERKFFPKRSSFERLRGSTSRWTAKQYWLCRMVSCVNEQNRRGDRWVRECVSCWAYGWGSECVSG